MDIFFMGLMGLICYVVARISLKLPLLPWKEAKVKSSNINKKINFKKGKSSSSNSASSLEEDEASPFEELLKDVKETSNHMIRFHDNRFVMIAEVNPVNYFLLSNSEQESIDVVFETWLAQINYPVQAYLQNRFIDLSEPIEEMEKQMNNTELPVEAVDYGQSLLRNLQVWEKQQPRYETKRFIVLHHTINANDIKADDEEELEDKILDKAFQELYRRYNTARNSLRKADMDVQLLSNEGIGEVLYYALNRRKAVKSKFKHFSQNEKLALYVTADQTPEKIELIKENIENEASEQKESQAKRTESTIAV